MIYFTLIMIIFCNLAYAGDISLIDKNVINKKQQNINTNQAKAISKNQDAALIKDDNNSDADTTSMSQFVEQENERIEALKLLNLDVQKDGLELKRKEIQAKIAQLNHASNINPEAFVPTERHEFIKAVIKVSSLIVTDDFKEALLQINGSALIVHEGDSISDGLIIKNIQKDNISLQDPNGKIENIYFSGT